MAQSSSSGSSSQGPRQVVGDNSTLQEQATSAATPIPSQQTSVNNSKPGMASTYGEASVQAAAAGVSSSDADMHGDNPAHVASQDSVLGTAGTVQNGAFGASAAGSGSAAASFKTAPSCSAPSSSAVRDASGRMWGWENGVSCVYRQQQAFADASAAASTQTTISWEEAPR